MLDTNKPIFQRGNSAASSQPKPKPSPEALSRIILEYDDDWLHERKGKLVTVKFLDGETLTGTIGKCRKFTFALQSEFGSVLVHKLVVKYITEVR